MGIQEWCQASGCSTWVHRRGAEGAGCPDQAVVLAVKRTCQGQLSGLDLLRDKDLVSCPWSKSTWGLSCWVPGTHSLPLASPQPKPAVLVKKDGSSLHPGSSPSSDSTSFPPSLGRRDAKCGKIQCQSSEARPLESNAVPIDTIINMNGRQIQCRGTHVYRGPEDEGDMLDPGLVMTGTKCGYNHVSPFLPSHSWAGLQRGRSD